MVLQGIGASAGIGIGRVARLCEQSLDYSAVQYAGKQAERERLKRAMETFDGETRRLAQSVRERVGAKEAEILTGQITMLSDPYMQSQMEELIDGGQCAESAVDAVCGMYIEMFAGVEDEMMRQRATDVRDIRSRMLGLLLGVRQVDVAALPAGTVLAARDLTPSMTVGLQPKNIAAILTEVGGKTSHSAILARALQLPAVLSIPGVLEKVQEGALAIVDGDEGLALLDPDERSLAEYTRRQEAQKARLALLDAYRARPTQDADGNRYALYANIGSLAESQAAADAGAEGIGLFRTEFLFMGRAALPSEEEQYEAYREVAERMQGREVIIRTLDIGGDKDVPYLHMEREQNPFLGHRAIRYCLDRPEVFRVQLRALLRAGAARGNIKLMLPLVTSVEEVRAAKALLAGCKAQLLAEGMPCDEAMQVGVMIETPAAALIADLLAQETDFFSIGTNDLVQYTMAVDRGNAMVEKLYSPFHPAVLRSIRSVIAAAKRAGIPVGMCGEAAADPCMAPLLLAFGLDEFSVSASAVLPTRRNIAAWHIEDARRVAEEAMGLSGAGGIEGYLKAAARA